MPGGSIEAALKRVEAALSRIEAVAGQPSRAHTELAGRHTALREAVTQSLSQLDELLAARQS
jgi:hypothetical protein